jgi:hypothetical protein
VVSESVIALTAKGAESTNMILLDAKHDEILRADVQVGPRSSGIQVLSGTQTQNYSCTPSCTPVSGQVTAGSGPCNDPSDIARDGSRCGGRAASVRPGGRP